MKKLILFILLLSVAHVCPVSAKSNQKQVLNTLEDIFSFENIDQLTRYFGSDRVYTELSYSGDPNNGGKGYLFSQVNFGTHHAVLVVWNHEGTKVVEVKSSAYYYDSQKGKIIFVPNKWNTIQGIHAGMRLSQLVKVNWFVLTFFVQPESLNNGIIFHGFGWLREKRSVSFSKEKLLYNYTLDVKRFKYFFHGLTTSTLKSNDKTVIKWNPMLEMITVYREGSKVD